MTERWEKVKTAACLAILDISSRANYCCSYGSPYSLQRRSGSHSSPISIQAWTRSPYVACGELFNHVLNMARMHLSWSQGLLYSMLCRTQSSMSNLSPLVIRILTSSFRVGGLVPPSVLTSIEWRGGDTYNYMLSEWIDKKCWIIRGRMAGLYGCKMDKISLLAYFLPHTG